MKNKPSKLMIKTQIRNAKINRITFLVTGILICLVFGFVFPIAFIIGGFFIFISYLTNKKYKELLNENVKEPEIKLDPVNTPEIIPAPVKKPEPVVINPAQLEKMKNMCIDIHKEYKELLKDYSDADTEERVYILKECYRKLNVMETTINKYNCYDDINMYDEYEKIEKKAKSFINAYIKEEREGGAEDYEIDVTQFSEDLDFIWDYITEKDEKLNKY